MALRIAVTGCHGQLGWELARSLQPLGEVVALARQDVNLADLAALERTMLALAPDLIVNCAAYTAVDRAESDEAMATRVNADAPGVLGDVARRLGAAVLHYSTDYVFDGTSPTPYRENDRPNPVNAYGRSKLAGEIRLAESGAAHLIVRTSWVYAARGSNFVLTMRRLARERETLQVVADQHGRPTWARWLAEATAQIVGELSRAREGLVESLQHDGGLLHLAGSETTTWHALAEAVVAIDRSTADLRVRRIEAVTTERFGAPARRPLCAVLDSSLAALRYGIVCPPWREQLRSALLEDKTSASPLSGV
jgi:dTDP-4-dehydrorhamnose reductase